MGFCFRLILLSISAVSYAATFTVGDLNPSNGVNRAQRLSVYYEMVNGQRKGFYRVEDASGFRTVEIDKNGQIYPADLDPKIIGTITEQYARWAQAASMEKLPENVARFLTRFAYPKTTPTPSIEPQSSDEGSDGTHGGSKTKIRRTAGATRSTAVAVEFVESTDSMKEPIIVRGSGADTYKIKTTNTRDDRPFVMHSTYAGKNRPQPRGATTSLTVYKNDQPHEVEFESLIPKQKIDEGVGFLGTTVWSKKDPKTGQMKTAMLQLNLRGYFRPEPTGNQRIDRDRKDKFFANKDKFMGDQAHDSYEASILVKVTDEGICPIGGVVTVPPESHTIRLTGGREYFFNLPPNKIPPRPKTDQIKKTFAEEALWRIQQYAEQADTYKCSADTNEIIRQQLAQFRN